MKEAGLFFARLFFLLPAGLTSGSSVFEPEEFQLVQEMVRNRVPLDFLK